MRDQSDVYKLSNGVTVPCMGFGMWQTPDGDVGVNAVKSAIKAGYTHIDTAQAYGNEDCVRIAIKETGADRKKLFITTKLWNNNHSYDLTMRSFDESLKKLGTDYVDLFLIHWPNPAPFRDHWQEANAESWKAMEELYEAGKIFDVPEMKELAEKYGRSIAQICIRWSLQRGYLPLPKSVTPARIEENLKVFDFELEEADVQLIAGLTGCVGLSGDPDTMPF